MNRDSEVFDYYMPRQATGSRKVELGNLVERLNTYRVIAVLDTNPYPEALLVIIPQGTAPEVVGEIMLLVTVHYRSLGLNSVGVTPALHDGSVCLRFR